MPDGRMQRIDDQRGTAYLVRAGRIYRAELSEVESRARVPSARVRFDLVRVDGVETAANVRLRKGTRTGRQQRRFGDLTGARTPGAKVSASAKATYGVDVTTRPLGVIRAWVGAMAAGDHAGAANLALPEIVFHGVDGCGSGRRRFRAHLEGSAFDRIDPESVDLHALDRFVTVEGLAAGAAVTASFVVDQGAVAEAWVGVRRPTEPAQGRSQPAIEVVRRGEVADEDVTAARNRLAKAMAQVAPRAAGGRIKLTPLPYPGLDRPNLAEAVVEVGGSPVRARGEGATMAEAVGLAVDRVRSQIGHLQDRRNGRRIGLGPVSGRWRHSGVRRPTQVGFDRPPGEREIVRRKSFAPERETLEEAAWDLALLDYDFYLFVDDATGVDTLLERGDVGDLFLRRPDGSGSPNSAVTPSTSDATDLGIVELEEPTPRLSVVAAVELLDGAARDLVFFVDEETDRANVVYRRLDGHYGLITPPTVDEGPDPDAG